MNFVTQADITAQLAHVDDPDVLERIDANPALYYALMATRPPNWWGTGIDPRVLISIARDQGIPVVYVPSAEVLRLLVDTNPFRRIAVIRKHAREILEQCLELIKQCDDPWVADAQYLVERAVSACIERHHEAAMALATSVGEGLALWASVPRAQAFKSEEEADKWHKLWTNSRKKYSWASTELSEQIGLQGEGRVLRQALIAPIPKFFTPYFPERRDALPDTISRHAVAHQPMAKHFTLENALIVIMLATSVLYDQNAYSRSLRIDDERDNYLGSHAGWGSDDDVADLGMQEERGDQPG